MEGVGAVGDARAGGARSLGVDRRARRRHAGRIEGQAEIVVGAEEDHIAPVDDRLGGRFDAVHADMEGIQAAAEQAIAGLDEGGEFIEQVAGVILGIQQEPLSARAAIILRTVSARSPTVRTSASRLIGMEIS